MERIVERVEFPIPQQPKAVRVAAYARVSSGKDAMLHSLSAQISYYSNLIQSHPGWLYSGVYADEALTGTKEDRPNFQRLLRESRAGNIDLIITKSVSRFARNTVTLLQTVRELKALGIGVYFEEQRIYTLSADGELMLTILASYAQAESQSASENAIWRIRKGFENGELINLRFLFGYTIVGDHIEVNPSEAKIVKEVFERTIAGESLTSIARNLNDRKVERVRGGAWTETQVKKLLSNEKYTGNALLQKSYRNNHLEKKKKRNRGELPMYYAEETHDAIIDMATFEKAQEVLAAIKARSNGQPLPELSAFSALIRCEKCGSSYIRRKSHGRPCWVCSTAIKRGKAFCVSPQLPEEKLFSMTAEVLGIQAVDEKTIAQRVDYISALDFVLTFHLVDGQTAQREWEYRSRAASWTPEMKERARQQTTERRMRECRGKP